MTRRRRYRNSLLDSMAMLAAIGLLAGLLGGLGVGVISQKSSSTSLTTTSQGH